MVAWDAIRYLARLMMLPRDPAVVIAACLDPVYSSLEDLLHEQSGVRIIKAPVRAPERTPLPKGGSPAPAASACAGY